MMKNIKRAFALLLAVLVIIFGGCGKEEATVTESPAGEIGNADESAQTSDEGAEESDDADEKTETNTAFAIEKKDADLLLEEAIDGTGCKAVFLETVEIDGNGYYTYSVTDPDGKDLKEGLAVDGFSGNVCVYNPDAGKVKDFDSFEYYDRSSARERNISWEGDFILNDSLKVSLVPADEDSFEFTVYKKDEEVLFGVARIDGDKAEWTAADEKEGLSFKMVDENTLQIVENGSLRISGQYVK